MAFIDYYKVMGIPKDTPQKDIRAAYRKRSKQFHPDLHPDDPKAKAKFQMLNEAYEVLNDPEKRAKYDQYGENWKQAEQFGGFGTDGGGGTSKSLEAWEEGVEHVPHVVLPNLPKWKLMFQSMYGQPFLAVNL